MPMPITPAPTMPTRASAASSASSSAFAPDEIEDPRVFAEVIRRPALVAEVRRLVASLLNDLPHAALDGLDLERGADGQTLGGVVRLSLFFRQEAP